MHNVGSCKNVVVVTAYYASSYIQTQILNIVVLLLLGALQARITVPTIDAYS